MTQLKPGLRLKSAACDAEVMVIKAAGEAALTCGGLPMLTGDEQPNGTAPDNDLMSGCLVGKRDVSSDQALELLCVKAGQGSLAIDGEALETKDTKKLPSSD